MSYYPTQENGGLPRRDLPPKPHMAEAERRVLVWSLERQEFGWFDAPPSWWKFRARRRWRDRVPLGFR